MPFYYGPEAKYLHPGHVTNLYAKTAGLSNGLCVRMKPMLIKNLHRLSSSSLRKSALEIAEAGITAVLPKNIIKETVSLKNNVLRVKNRKFDLRRYRRLFIFAFGKAAADSAQALEKILGNRITGGAVIDVKSYRSKRLKTFVADHPLPTARNIRASKEFVKLVKDFGGLKQDDLVIFVVSGGASALLCHPNKLTCTDLGKLTNTLFERGADIAEINTIRKHLSLIHGGYLAKYIYPARAVALLYSDVPTADLSVIASGPTFMDKTTVSDARRLARKYSLKKLPFIETPKDKKYFENVTNVLVCDNGVALKAMYARAARLKFKAIIYTNRLHGEARNAGRGLFTKLKSGSVILAAGETTVRIKGSGKGGRNQELVLGVLPHLKKGEVIVSIASDGKDYIKGAGGAIADLNTVSIARKMKLDPKKYLDNNDSYNFFKKTGDLILTDPTGANVSDLVIALHSK